MSHNLSSLHPNKEKKGPLNSKTIFCFCLFFFGYYQMIQNNVRGVTLNYKSVTKEVLKRPYFGSLTPLGIKVINLV